MKISKKIIAGLLMLILSLVARESLAQSICVVVSKNIPPYIEALKGIKSVIQGEIKRMDLDGKREKGGEVVKVLRKSDCGVVVPIGSLALDVVRLQVTDRPIVYSMIASPLPEIAGVRNISGVHMEPPAEDLLASLKRLVPNVSRVGMIYNPDNASRFADAARRVADKLKINLVMRQVRDMKSMAAAAKDLLPKVDAMLMAPDPTTANRKAFEYLLLECFRRSIPLVGLSKKHVRDGAIFSFDIHYFEIGRKTGQLIKRILQAREAASGLRLSSHGPLILNLKTAKRLGIHIDESIVDSAAHIFR